MAAVDVPQLAIAEAALAEVLLHAGDPLALDLVPHAQAVGHLQGATELNEHVKPSRPVIDRHDGASESERCAGSRLPSRVAAVVDVSKLGSRGLVTSNDVQDRRLRHSDLPS